MFRHFILFALLGLILIGAIVAGVNPAAILGIAGLMLLALRIKFAQSKLAN